MAKGENSEFTSEIENWNPNDLWFLTLEKLIAWTPWVNELFGREENIGLRNYYP